MCRLIEYVSIGEPRKPNHHKGYNKHRDVPGNQSPYPYNQPSNGNATQPKTSLLGSLNVNVAPSQDRRVDPRDFNRNFQQFDPNRNLNRRRQKELHKMRESHLQVSLSSWVCACSL